MRMAEDLKNLLSPAQVSTNLSILEQHSKDESYHLPVLPDVVVFPESTEDVVKVVKYAAAERVPLVPFGVGSGLEGHVVPVKQGISLDLLRMNRIFEVRPDDFLVCVQPGVTRIQLNQELKRYGLFFPVDPGADASLGGMAATNASGTTTVRYGAMKDNVRSLRVVLPSGEVMDTASLAAKSSSGYNLVPTLFLEFHGNRKSVDADVELAKEIAIDEGCQAFEFVADEKSRLELWEARHSAAYAFKHQHVGFGHMATDVCVPLSKLPEAVTRAKRLLDESGLAGAVVGHVGDGNFHVSLAVDPADLENMARANQFNEQLVHHALSLRGTSTGEHGVGLGKRKYQVEEHGAALEIMRAIKAVIDPLHIMNPGKLVDET